MKLLTIEIESNFVGMRSTQRKLNNGKTSGMRYCQLQCDVPVEPLSDFYSMAAIPLNITFCIQYSENVFCIFDDR